MRAAGPIAVILLAGLTATAHDGLPQAGQRHSSGLLLVGPIAGDQQRIPEPLATAFSDARWLAQWNPGAFGYPWADLATGELVLSVASEAGEALVGQWTTEDAGSSTVTRRIRRVDRSWAQLERIRREAIGAVDGLPDAGAIYRTAPDWEHNRVLITIDRSSDALLRALATRYGTDAIAIRVEPRQAGDNERPRTGETVLLLGGLALILGLAAWLIGRQAA